MLSYAICEIGGKQYKVESDKPFWVNEAPHGETLEVNVLMRAIDGKLEIGKPFLKEKLKLKVLETSKGKKIRVAKYKAKANYRRVKGYRSILGKVVLSS